MPKAESRAGLVLQLSLRDYLHEWILSGCFVLAIAAVLMPLLVLFGLKYGIISNLLAPLKEDPRYRQIQPIGSGSYGPAWFDAMAQRPDVAFIVPRTRTIAATIRLRKPDSEVGRILDVELIPSAGDDPTLVGVDAPAGLQDVVLSLNTADKLRAAAGDKVEGIVSRIYHGEQQTELIPLNVLGVAPAAAFGRDGLFITGDLLVAVEDFLDGHAVPALGWEGSQAVDGPRHFSGFRLYARNIEDVAVLRKGMLDQGIDVRTRIADIELVKKLDRNLGIVFWVIAVIAASGFGLSFGTNVWANVDRKRQDFSVLRLIGFRTSGIVWFPIVQATLTGVLGWVLATLGFFAVQTGLNSMFADNIGGGQDVCRLLPWHFVMALLLTLTAAAVAAVLGGLRVAQLEPSLALREV